MEQMQHEDFYDASQRSNKNFGTTDYYLKKWKVLRGYSQERFALYDLALKLTAVCQIKGIRMVMENPWHPTNFTNHFWFMRASVIDKDRTRRGDYFKKPTAYWYVNCEATWGQSYQQTPLHKIKTITAGSGATNTKRKKRQTMQKEELDKKYLDKTSDAGICDEARSMISPDYARNFICDFIIGRSQPEIHPTLF